jgi:hypothetical protein
MLQTKWTKYETGATPNVGGTNLLMLASAVGVRAEWLLHGTGPMEAGPAEPVNPAVEQFASAVQEKAAAWAKVEAATLGDAVGPSDVVAVLESRWVRDGGHVPAPRMSAPVAPAVTVELDSYAAPANSSGTRRAAKLDPAGGTAAEQLEPTGKRTITAAKAHPELNRGKRRSREP